MNKWRDCTIKNDPSLIDDEDLTIRCPKNWQLRLVIGFIMALNVLVALTIGGIV